MRKIILLLCAFLLSSCRLISLDETEPVIEAEVTTRSETFSNPQTEGVTTSEAMTPVKVETGMLYDSNYERLARNVRIKRADGYGITYEYKDVRIDEIAYMASKYCFKQKGKKAVLYDSQLFRNFSRRATFHCLELQN